MNKESKLLFGIAFSAALLLMSLATGAVCASPGSTVKVNGSVFS